MNFPKLYFLLLVDSIGFFNPSLPSRHVEAVLTARNYNCPRSIRNGSIKPLKSRAKVNCYYGFKLFGPRYVWCDGRKQPLPVCIRTGCAPPSEPSHGTWTFSKNNALGTLQCDEGFVAGDDVHIFCDGHVWDSVGQRPTCTSMVRNPNTTCNFEDPGLCGWTQDFYHDFDWRRNNYDTPSGHLRTGPSADHTFGKGFAGAYMYIEASSPRMENERARLFSPTYPANYSVDACFIFWYHMYGATMGSLNVYVLKKGDGLAGSEAVFSLSGNQGNMWRQAFVPFKPQDTQFQIVLEGVVGHGYEGDAAVDDVKLGHGAECLPPPKPAPTTPTVSAYTEATVFEVSKEGADISSFTFSPLVSSNVFPSTPDEDQIIVSIPHTSVKPSTIDTIKSQTLMTQTIYKGSSISPMAFDTDFPTEDPTLINNISTIIPKLSTIGSDSSQNLTTVTNTTVDSISHTIVNFTDTQSSVPVVVSNTKSSSITSAPTEALPTRLHSDGPASNMTFRSTADLKPTSRPTLAYLSTDKTTLNYQPLKTTPTVRTSSVVTHATRMETPVKYSSVVTTTVPTTSSRVTFTTSKVTTVKQLATNRTTLAPIATRQNATTRFRFPIIAPTRVITRVTTLQRNLIPNYVHIKSTTTAVKRFNSSYTLDNKTLMKFGTQTTPSSPVETPSPAPSSRRNSAYQFLTSKLQQYMSPNQTPARSKVESVGGSVGATLGMALAGAAAALGAAFVVVRLASRRLVRKLQSREPEDSDVRFLTSDEILDFNIARPSDCDL